jgi:putative transposase
MIAPTSAPSAQLSADQLAEAQRFAQLAAPKAQTFDLPSDPTARYHLWHQLADRLGNGEVLTDEETQWHSRYPKHPDFASIRRMFEFAEQARA